MPQSRTSGLLNSRLHSLSLTLHGSSEATVVLLVEFGVQSLDLLKPSKLRLESCVFWTGVMCLRGGLVAYYASTRTKSGPPL